jgi:hypothetical protein
MGKRNKFLERENESRQQVRDFPRILKMPKKEAET